jgi:tetratricopeptide (TPR) repeat protein
MVQMAFFLRFKHQLQRIRPKLVPRLEDVVARAVEEAGGNITGERGFIRAVFDENSLGFWINILLLIETLTQTMEKAAADLHGYSLLIGTVLPDTPHLCRSLSGEKGGFFFDQTAAEAMRPYITFEEQGKWTKTVEKYGIGPFSRLNEIKTFTPTVKLEFPLNKNNETAEPGQQPAVLIASPSFEGKRDKLYLRVAGFSSSGDNDDFSPLFVRFGYGGVSAITDSWAGWMQPPAPEKKMHTEWEFLFRQRLRNKTSAFTVRTASRFFKSLLKLYRGLAQTKNKIPIIILENIQNAGQTMASIIIESLYGQSDILLLGTCTGELTDEVMTKWNPLFPQLTRVNPEEESDQGLPDLPIDLWEIGYACLLLGRYFPPDLIPRLLEETGKSSLIISRSLSLLYTLRAIDTPLDPRPWHRQFQYQAETVLGDRRDRIREIVHSRLFAWVAQRKIDPCLRLLEILKELNNAEEIDDSLILESIHSEIAGADEASLENIRCNGMNSIAGPVRTPILNYILETLLALHSGNVENIHAAFAAPLSDCSAFPLLKAQALINQSLYRLGLRDIEPAMEAVKEASMLCHEPNNIHLAQIHRLFALASLLRHQVGEAIDYLGFALENASKSGNFQDIGTAAYYAASVQLLYGNLSRAKILAEKSSSHFLKAGSPEWADRSRFLMGRIIFEIGSYRQAADLFEDIRQNPEGAYFQEKDDLLETWAYRAKACCGSFHDPKPQGGRDADLFEIEALCLAENYSRAAELSGAAPSSSWGDDFFCIERPDWRSGFAQCELLCFSWDYMRGRMLNTYHAVAQTALSSTGSEEALRAMQRVLRSSQFSEIDPSDVFYHYAWYRVLQQTGSSQVDISTAVSVAFNRLQSRASRIDDAETRRQYLTQPLWNKALGQAAREFKLV